MRGSIAKLIRRNINAVDKKSYRALKKRWKALPRNMKHTLVTSINK